LLYQRQYQENEKTWNRQKIFAKGIYDLKNLVSKTYRDLLKLSSRKMNNPIEKWLRDLDRSAKKINRWQICI
jgi:hypothetical protein